jgi:NCAIR mutase (PurE)-related protein
MTESDLRHMLDEVRAGTLDADAAAARIRDALAAAPFEDLGFARVDTHRHHRQGFPEVILGLGKTPSQIAAVAERIVARGHSLLVTRATIEAWDAVRALVPNAT